MESSLETTSQGVLEVPIMNIQTWSLCAALCVQLSLHQKRGKRPSDEVPSCAGLPASSTLRCQVHTTPSCDFHLYCRIVFDVMLILALVQLTAAQLQRQSTSVFLGWWLSPEDLRRTSTWNQTPGLFIATITPKFQDNDLSALCLQFWTRVACYLLDT